MKIESTGDPAEFRRRAESFLARDPLRHTVIATVVDGYLTGLAAGALTAHVSKTLRDNNVEVCLCTDLANPTANKIYRAIGYEPVRNFVHYTFG
jgi:hypothetical protein